MMYFQKDPMRMGEFTTRPYMASNVDSSKLKILQKTFHEVVSLMEDLFGKSNTLFTAKCNLVETNDKLFSFESTISDPCASSCSLRTPEMIKIAYVTDIDCSLGLSGINGLTQSKYFEYY